MGLGMWICHKFCQIIEVPKDFRECHISCKIIYKTSWFQRQCAQWMLIIYSNLSKSIKYINQLYFFGFPSVFYSSHLQFSFWMALCTSSSVTYLDAFLHSSLFLRWTISPCSPDAWQISQAEGPANFPTLLFILFSL